eukprot:TRINITY_DN1903_c0_g1_i1.p1 TRINITY_DN1903_c0_g1~~TRINITY_DN1903_c0_g1_i1.p1  ORF type:complete len:794 (-),score=298.87 TRINITY_DN1903_c0_g1_i1:332-2713(-)
MGKTNFQYDETGTTYYYVFLTFLGLVLFPSTYYVLFRGEDGEEGSDGKGSGGIGGIGGLGGKKKSRRHGLSQVSAQGTPYWEALREKSERLCMKDPWSSTKRGLQLLLLAIGWILFASIIHQISQFDYELANFDPYEILEVSYDATAKDIKKKYRELSLKYHPDKPTGNEKLFMKLTKAYDALTDDTAKYNWEHYGNPDGPQAMQFGIGLPAWIVEEKNSLWVLGVYTLIFMIGLPTAVYYWWSNSIKFSGEQVLLDTSQLYYYFFHKTPQMMLKRILMVLAASLEFERGHNQAVVERATDNVEIPQLIKHIPNLGINNKEKPLCFGYSVKARTLLFAHLSRIPLPRLTLHLDRLFIVEKAPFLIHEMVNCICQLILLALAGRIARRPSLDTIESTMKLSPMIVQALWDKKSPLLQLPHIEEEHLKHFYSRKRNIKTLHQLAQMKDEDRRNLLRSLSDEQYKDVLRVLSQLPLISIDVTTEVVDDEEQHVVTAGSLVTVSLNLYRRSMDSLMTGSSILKDGSDEATYAGEEDSDIDDLIDFHPEDSAANPEEDKKKAPVWKKPQKKKSSKKAGGSSKAKAKSKAKAAPPLPASEGSNSHNNNNPESQGDGSGGSDVESGGGSESEEDPDKAVGAASNVEDDDEAEWQRFQSKMNKREKALEGKSRVSHSVHCPYFPDDKQEYWWCYISERKTRALMTPPNLVTSLVNNEFVKLVLNAPAKPGPYTFTVCVRSDSYSGLDIQEDIKLDVQEAREAPTEHPQWEFEDDDENEQESEEDSDDEYATDDEDFEDEDD